MDTHLRLRFLTASLHVVFLLPTPLVVPLEIRGRVKEIKGRKGLPRLPIGYRRPSSSGSVFPGVSV